MLVWKGELQGFAAVIIATMWLTGANGPSLSLSPSLWVLFAETSSDVSMCVYMCVCLFTVNVIALVVISHHRLPVVRLQIAFPRLLLVPVCLWCSFR